MAKVKLDLRGKIDEALRLFATEHQTAMQGNANYPSPVPDAGAFAAALTAFGDKMTAVSAAETTLLTLRAERDALRTELEANLTARGNYVELTSGGDEAKILSAAFQVQSGPTVTTSLPAPVGFASSMGDNPGEVDLTCHAINRAKAYTFEYRTHSETAAPGPWLPGKLSSRSGATIGGLASGVRYAFRVRALGPNDLESPWSVESVCMAP